MHENQFDLLKTRRFLPLFVTQFLNAFNDNIYRSAMGALITFVIYASNPQQAEFLVAIAAGIFTLPFFIFSATAGQLADKFDKAKLARIVKFFEIIVGIIGTIGLYHQNIPILMTTLFCMGAHSAFFGPIKYAILPDHLYEDELIGANALIEAATFLAILLGVLLGNALIDLKHGITITATALLSVATIGWITSFFIPPSPAPRPELKINPNIIKETWEMMKTASHNRDVFLCIMGLSWFWLVGGAFLSQFTTFTKEAMHASQPVVSLFLATFSIGIAIGSMICNRLLDGEINAKYTPLALLVISIFLGDVHMATRHLEFDASAPLLTIGQFLSQIYSWRVLLDFAILSIASGIYMVPLYAILQTRSDKSNRARMIACNNIFNALFMTIASIVIITLLAMHLSITQIFLVIAIVNAFVALYIIKLVPYTIVHSVIKWILVSLYRVKVHGLENYKSVEGPMVIIANHTSFLDAMLITVFLPNRITFAINTHIASQWWMKPLLAVVNTYPIDPANPMTTKSLIKTVKSNKRVMIFPEGRITVTGALMKVYEGPGLIADATGATILPIRIDGAQYSPLSKLRGKVHIRMFPKVTMTILPPQKFEIPKDIKGRRRRELISEKLYDLMKDMMFESSPKNTHLFDSLIYARKIHGRHHVVAEDITRNPITLSQLVKRSLVLGRHIKYQTRQREVVGVLLPNTVNTLTVFFALQAYSRVPAMLNYSAGPATVLNACQTAKLTQVYTSRKFVERGKLEETIEALSLGGFEVCYLEDMVTNISLTTKLVGALTSLVPKRHFNHYNYEIQASDPAVILFTSGSEGTPKGVVLSHANIQSNRFQMGASIDFSRRDVVMNALPMFHSFGLTAGTLLPVLSGLKVFLYPSPLHYRIIPEITYEFNATILFGTDTFLANYAKYCHPYDFYSVRYVIAGAEKLKDSTRKVWMEKLGIRVLEGYGATEASPVLSTNTPMHNKLGSVGRLLPGIQYKLEPVPGIDEGGRFWVKGPNIMLGYMLHDHPGQIMAPKDGWYDTGDIVHVDVDGYVTILGRAKRFAKIAGEMVSLSAVEAIFTVLWPDYEHAVVSLPDPQKGERLSLITTCHNIERSTVIDYIKTQQLSELMMPKQVEVVSELPVLGTGKIDYQATKELALQRAEMDKA